MKKTLIRKLILLILFVGGTHCYIYAQYQVVTPSGHIIYWEPFGNGSDIYAVICSPNPYSVGSQSVDSPNTNYESWSGYSKPGGQLIIPDSVSYLGNMIPVKIIAPFAFYKCSSLTSVVIPNTVNEIEGRAFSECSGLVSVTIGTSANNIGRYAFYCSGQSSIDTVYYNANYTENLPSSSPSSTDLYSSHKWRTTTTATLIVGDDVTQINTGVFIGYCGFKNIIMGSALTQIGPINYFRYSGTSGTTTTIFKSQNPPYLGQGVNFGGDSNTCTVPCGRSTFYYNQWSTRFASYNESPTGVSVSVSVSNPNHGVAQIEQDAGCDSIAIISATPYYGYLFTQWNDGNSENPRTVYLTNPSQLFIAQFVINPEEPDTIYIHDTTIITNYVHDTTYLPIYLHDTVPMIEYLHDTIYLPQYIHDTAIVNIYIHDTIYLPQYFHDTTTVTEYDTIYITLHDTTIVNNYLRDTIYLPLYIHDTTYITQTDTVMDTLTVYDTITNIIVDTITNTVYDTFVVLTTDTLWLRDTVFIHDTIYIYDTIYVGVDEVDAINIKIYTSQGQIVVDGVEGNKVWLFDVYGRVLATKQDEYSSLHFDVPASGTYIVKIGNHPARKVVMIR